MQNRRGLICLHNVDMASLVSVVAVDPVEVGFVSIWDGAMSECDNFCCGQREAQEQPVFSCSLLVLAGNLHKLGHHVTQHSFRQCAHLTMNNLSA